MSHEAKFRLRVIFLVGVVFFTVMLTAFYASLLLQQQKQFATNLTSRPTNPASYSANFLTEQMKLQITQKNGLTTYSGEISKPTPCHKIETAAEQNGAVVTIKFKTVESTGDILCAQVITFERVNGELPANTDLSKAVVFLNGVLIPKK